MKVNFTLLFLVTSFFTVNAQEIPFGDFEKWDDISESFNESLEKPLEPKTLLVPEDGIPAFALVFLFFGNLDLNNIVQSSAKEDISTNLLNLARTSDSHGGDYALKFGGSSHNAFAHLRHTSELGTNQLPNSLSFYYKHVGNNKDTLRIISNIASEQSSYDSLNYENTRAIIDGTIISETTEGYKWKSIAVEDFNVNAKMDTFNFDMFFFKKQPDSTSYWIIDNVQWNIETPTYDTDYCVLFRLGQSIDNQTIYPYLDQSKHSFISSAILSENGAMIKSFENWSDEINISELTPGRYIFYVQANGKRFSKLFIKY